MPSNLSAPDDYALSPASVALVFALGVAVVAWPSRPDVVGVAFVALFAALMATAFFFAYRARALLTALFVALTALAHGATLGDAVQVGIRRAGLLASAGSVQLAVVLVAVFALATTLVSLVAQRHHQRAAPVPDAGAHRSFLIGLAVLFLACAAAAFETGAWTQWGGRAPEQVSGGLRLELLYPAVLFIAVGVASLPMGPTRPRSSFRLATVAIALGLAVLLFALQSRRIMFSCGILVALATLRYPPAQLARAARQRVGTVVRVGLIAAILLVALVASAGWRMAASRGQVGFASGLRSAVSAAIDPSDFSAELVEGRMTYLWMDSVTVQLSDSMALDLDLTAALGSAVLVALPSMVYRGKDAVTRTTCETAFAAVGVDVDLPCTPTAEAYLAFGPSGVLPVALLWGLYIALADVLTRRFTHLGRVAGLALFAPCISIEVGLFPMVQGARAMLIAVAVVGAVALLIGLPDAIRRRAPTLDGR